MLINEIIPYAINVRMRVKTGNESTAMQYQIEADGTWQPRITVAGRFGVNNLLSAVAMSVVTNETTKLTLTAISSSSRASAISRRDTAMLPNKNKRGRNWLRHRRAC